MTSEVTANDFLGSCMGAKINAAVLWLASNPSLIHAGGVIRVKGKNHTASTMIDLRGTQGVVLKGDGNANSPSPKGCNLQWTGSAGSGPMVDLTDSRGVELSGIAFSAGDPYYNDSFLKTGTFTNNVSGLHIHHCAFIGSVNQPQLIGLDTVVSGEIEHCTFRYGQYHIKATGPSNNALRIAHCNFDHTASVAHIGVGNATSWTIANCTFQSENKPAIKLVDWCSNITLDTNWAADIAGNPVTVFDLRGYRMRAFRIVGNTIVVNNGGTCIALDGDTMAQSTGGTIENNVLIGSGTAVNLGASHGVGVSRNFISTTIPLDYACAMGRAPTSYTWTNNYIDASIQGATTKVGAVLPYGATGIMPLTQNKSTGVAGGIVGSGYVQIMASDCGTGTFRCLGILALQHANQSVRIVDDANASFSTVKGTANRINVYYDEADNYAGYKMQNLCGTNFHVVVNSQSPY